MTTRRIVVGVDGSEPSRAALRWAADEARLRGVELEVVHAWQSAPSLVPGTPVTADDWRILEDAADALLDTIVAETLGERSEVQLSTVAVHGPAANVLVEAAEDAELVVVGSRGLGGFRELLLGSVSHHVAQHAGCPVVVVRDGGTERERTAAREGAASA